MSLTAALLIGCFAVTLSFITTAAQNSTTPQININLQQNSTVMTPINGTTIFPNVTTRPAVNFTIPASSTTQAPITVGSCAGPNLCCSGVNSSCQRQNCFCDVACLRFHDCCPDFNSTCLSVNNSNSTNPNNTLPLTGRCSAQPAMCCSGANFSCFRGCFCDEVCKQLDDCCPDFNSTCIMTPINGTTIFPNITTRPASSTTQAPITVGSCAGPNLCCSGQNNGCRRQNCFCDVACLRLRDCCPDFNSTCLSVNNINSTNSNNTLPLTGRCSAQPAMCCSGTNVSCFRGCFCDEVCKQYNDCCPDYNSTCTVDFTTTPPPPFPSTPTVPGNNTQLPQTDVLTIVSNLEVEVLALESSTEEERQAALQQAADWLGNFLRGNYNDILSVKITSIKQESPCD